MRAGQFALRSAEWFGRFAILPIVRRDVSCDGRTAHSFGARDEEGTSLGQDIQASEVYITAIEQVKRSGFETTGPECSRRELGLRSHKHWSECCPADPAAYAVSLRSCGGEIFPRGKATGTNRWSWSPGHTRSRTAPRRKVRRGRGRERRQSALEQNRRRSASRDARWRVPTCCEKLGPGSPYDRAWVAGHEDKLRYRGDFRDR